MKIIWSPFATEKVSEIAGYIAEDKPVAAEKWVDTIFNYVKRLAKFPQMGRAIPEANRKEIREILFKNYRIIYRYDKEQITILTVKHGKQILPIEELNDK